MCLSSNPAFKIYWFIQSPLAAPSLIPSITSSALSSPPTPLCLLFTFLRFEISPQLPPLRLQMPLILPHPLPQSVHNTPQNLILKRTQRGLHKLIHNLGTFRFRSVEYRCVLFDKIFFALLCLLESYFLVGGPGKGGRIGGR